MRQRESFNNEVVPRSKSPDFKRPVVEDLAVDRYL